MFLPHHHLTQPETFQSTAVPHARAVTICHAVSATPNNPDRYRLKQKITYIYV